MTDLIDIFTQTHGHKPAFTQDVVQAILQNAFPSAEIQSITLNPDLADETWMATLKVFAAGFESMLRSDSIIELLSVDFEQKSVALSVRPLHGRSQEAWTIVDVCHKKDSPVIPTLKGIFTSYPRARKNFLAMCNAHPELPVGDTLTVPLEHGNESVMSIMRTRLVEGE